MNWRRTLLTILILLSGSLSSLSPVHAKEILVLASDSTKTTQQISADIQKKIPTAKVISAISNIEKNRDVILITIGPSALQVRLANDQFEGATISVFTSSQVYQSLLGTTPESNKKSVTAIYADPAPVNQLRLINLLFKKPINVATILSSKTRYLEKILLNAANQTDTQLTIERWSDDETINQVLNNVSTAQVILATPDNNVFSQNNMRNILLTSYRRNQLVIGFSPSLVKAGALATTYSDMDDITTQLAEVVKSYNGVVQSDNVSEKLPAPQFPIYFKTVVNDKVAHSMGMIVSDEVMQFSRQPLR